jgi:hypothetical protein
MHLNVKDRFAVLGVLPKKGDFLTMQVVEELTKLLQVTPAEAVTLNMQNNGDRLTWSPDMEDGESSFAVSDSQKTVIVDALKGLNARKELTADHMNVYKLFVQAA